MIFCLYQANTFVERYEKTITDFTQFAFSVRQKVQIKPSFYTDMIGIVYFKVIPSKFMKRFPVRTIWELLKKSNRLELSGLVL